jgi:predicted CXXCH cytochrome family protein
VPEAPKSIRLIVPILFALCLAGFAPASQANQDKNTVPARPMAQAEKVVSARPSDPNLYAGSETCATCHEDIGKSHEKSPHAKTELSKNAAFKGCEGCHGPGKAHAEGGGDTTTIVSFKNLSKAESTRICLDCHQQNEEHANYPDSRHARNKVGCLDCHSSHKARTETQLLKMSQPQLCNGCHQKAKPDVSKPLHHKLNEGLTGCTNCHSTHGGAVRQPVPRSQAGPDAGPHASARRPRQGVHPLAEVQVRTGENQAVGRLWVNPQTAFIPNLLEES